MLEKPGEEEKEAAFGRKEMETNVTRETILREGKHLQHTLRFNGIYTAREGHFGSANRHKTRTAIKEPVKRRL